MIVWLPNVSQILSQCHIRAPQQLRTTITINDICASSVPPELIEHILSFAEDQNRLTPYKRFDPMLWWDEVRHIPICTSTRLYWAQITWVPMFMHLVLPLQKLYKDCDVFFVEVYLVLDLKLQER